MKSNLFLIALLSFAASAHAAGPSYAGQQTRAIKALSADERDALIAGAGMGYARAAELNRHPGPMHALELKPPLGLSAEAVEQMDALMKRHKTEARALGAEVVRLEAGLDALFAGGKPGRAAVEAKAVEIGVAQARYRASHLTTHIETARAMTPEQIARYDQLRGYTAASANGGKFDGHVH